MLKRQSPSVRDVNHWPRLTDAIDPNNGRPSPLVIDAEWEETDKNKERTDDDAIVTLVCFYLIMMPICWVIYTLCKNGIL